MDTSTIIFIPMSSTYSQELFDICQDSDLRKYLMEGMEMTLEDCKQMIVSNENFLKSNPVGLYLVKMNDSFIGYGGFKDTFPKSKNIDFMYALIGRYFGQRLGTQIAEKLLRLHEASGSQKKLTAVVNSENTASIKILERFGFIHQGKAPGELSHLDYYIKT